MGQGEDQPESTVHIVDIDSGEIFRQFGGRQQIQRLKQSILRFVLTVVAGSVDKHSKRAVPHPARYLQRKLSANKAEIHQAMITFR
jgi:hypothetical protein